MQVKARDRSGGHADAMTKHAHMLIVIADGAHARFVRPAANGALHTVSSVDSVAAQKRSSDLGSDHPGASFHSNSSARHSLAPRSDPHELAELEFAHLVAEEIDAVSGHAAFDELLLTAPPRIVNAIRDKLTVETAATLVGTLGKDLTKVPDDALRPHLREWLDAPPRRS
jgi:protein required for attachment to host cells